MRGTDNVRIVVVALLMALLAGGGALGRKQSPLLPAEGGKGRSRATECQFGKQLKELGTSWFADLGPPFGVMYCIRCQCVPVQKKRRIVARVQCKNIKNECPTPSCDEPVLLPGQCCKLCPQDIMDGPGIVRDVAAVPTPEEEERNMKHFAALLTGRTSMVLHRDDAVMSSSPVAHQELPVATARFTFHKKHLYYSFYTSASVRPRALQFVDHEGNILEEQALADTEYGNNTGKVCGVWRRVPREYRRFLREERMLVTLMWPDNVSLSGLVVRYRTLSTELFSSLLDVAPGADRGAMSGAGGGAVVSASSSAPTVHIHLTFNGVFSPQELYDVPITVRLEGTDRQHVVLEEVVIVSKPGHELNEIEVVSPVTAADLRHLTRGKLRLVVENKRNPDALRLEGRVQTRVTCEVFQCLLSSADSDGEEEDASRLTPASGVGLFYVNRDGALVYTVQLDSLDNRPAALLTLVSGRGKRRLELEDLTPSLVSNNATGTLDRPSPRELEQLYAGELSLNVATESASSLLRGRLAARPVADSRTGPVPVLLRRGELDTPAGITGLAWVAVDMECTLHYELALSGLTDEDGPLELYWEELPFIAPFAPVSRRLLEEFSGSTLEGFVLGLSPEELARVDNSVNYLEVREAAGTVMLRTPVLKVRVPAPCRPHYTDNSVPAAPSDPGGNDITACYHDDRFHDDGSQWSARGDPCAMCSCQRGRVVCDSMPCPSQSCGRQGQRQPAGECCPVCVAGNPDGTTNTTGRGCYLAGQFHTAGSSWHPYLPPNGFDTCAVCSCDQVKMNVRCSRVRCPTLDCDEHRAFRSDKKACCKQCPEAPPVLEPKEGFAKDAQDPWTRSDVLAAGGCDYIAGRVVRNGEEWNPRVPPFGEDKCVKCRCKDGKVHCDRKRCSRPPCNKDDACCHQCKRMHTRHHKEKHFN